MQQESRHMQILRFELNKPSKEIFSRFDHQ